MVDIKHRLFVLFLTLLVANPFCCCLAKGGAEHSAPDSKAEEHSCCSESKSTPTKKPAKPCHCDERGDSSAVLSDPLSADVPLLKVLKKIAAPEILFGPVDLARVTASTREWPPPWWLRSAGITAPGRQHSLWHGVFLI